MTSKIFLCMLISLVILYLLLAVYAFVMIIFCKISEIWRRDNAKNKDNKNKRRLDGNCG